VEPLTRDATFVARPMFGCVACYLSGRLVLVLADRGEPWQGLLIPSERSAHASILADHPALRVHPVLCKWLYLADGNRRFTTVAVAMLESIVSRDARFGVEPPLARLPRRGLARSPRSGSNGTRRGLHHGVER
jgi:hypothetical protein